MFSVCYNSNHAIIIIVKKYIILPLLLISMIGMKQNCHHTKKIGISLKKIIKQLLLMCYLVPKILNKQKLHMYQNIVQMEKNK